MTTTTIPQRGDVITYQPFGGGTRRCVVTAHYDDIKNGRPGFDAVTANEETVWGYDDQIIRNEGPLR